MDGAKGQLKALKGREHLEVVYLLFRKEVGVNCILSASSRQSLLPFNSSSTQFENSILLYIPYSIDMLRYGNCQEARDPRKQRIEKMMTKVFLEEARV